jgi:hypothetical protein
MTKPITSEENLLLYSLYQCPYKELPSFLFYLEDSDIHDVCAVELAFGVDAEQRSFESITEPLSLN